MRVLVLALLLTACARPGIDDDQPTTTVTRPGDGDAKPNTVDPYTDVGFDVFEPPQLAIKSCVREEVARNPVVDGAVVTIDGDPSDWPQSASTFLDPINDHTGATDLTRLKTLYNGSELFLGVEGASLDTNDYIYLEMGSLSISPQSELDEKSLQWLRISIHGLEWWQNNNWQPMTNAALAKAQWAGNFVEMQLSRFFIGQVISQPTWWLKVYAKAPDNSVRDTMGIVYFPSTVTQDQQRFLHKTCEYTSVQKQPYHVSMIRDANIDANLAEEYLGVARQAIMGFYATHPERRLPISELSFILTKNGVNKPAGRQDSLPALQVLQAFRLDLSTLGATVPERSRHAWVAQEIWKYLSYVYIKTFEVNQSALLESTIFTWLMSPLIETQLNRALWLQYYWSEVLPFSASPFAESPQRTRAKGMSLGFIMENRFDKEAAFAAWLSTANEQEFLTNVKARVSDKERADYEKLRIGWLENGDYHPEYSPLLLQDVDEDGLPGFVELRLRTKLDSADSDKDGWSDTAEWHYQTDPLNSMVHPNQIVMDNLLGDWRDLVANRIQADADSATTECNGMGDITSFVALAQGNNILIATQVNRAMGEDGSAVQWDIDLDFPALGKQFLVRVVSGQRGYVVYEKREGAVVGTFTTPFKMGQPSLEVLFDGDSLGLPISSIENVNSVNIRVATLINSGAVQHCDDTPWFNPAIRKNKRL